MAKARIVSSWRPAEAKTPSQALVAEAMAGT